MHFALLACRILQVKIVGDLSLTLPSGEEASATGLCVFSKLFSVRSSFVKLVLLSFEHQLV